MTNIRRLVKNDVITIQGVAYWYSHQSKRGGKGEYFFAQLVGAKNVTMVQRKYSEIDL